jgi:ribose transport system substrate-binding protein
MKSPISKDREMHIGIYAGFKRPARGLIALAIVAAMAPLVAMAATAAISLGPAGALPTPPDQVRLRAEDVLALRGRGYTAALLMHASSDFSTALTAGASAAFGELGIKVVALTDAEMDPKKQRADLETVLALKPDIIVSLVIDPVSGAVAFRQALRQGVKLVFISNAPQGFVHGRDYAGIVTDDVVGMGVAAARMLAASIGGRGEVALIHHAANYFVTNQRDRAVGAELARLPGIRVVADHGIANPNDGEVVAAAILTQHPDVKAIYAPWDVIAEGVTAALRAAGRRDVKVVTIDLGAASALDMVKRGNVAGIVTDMPYDMGRTLATVGALAMLNRPTPAFVTYAARPVTTANLAHMWQQALHRAPPPALRKALEGRP